MTGLEPAILSGISGIQSPVSGAMNTFTPARGATTLTNQVVIAEKPSDIPGDWALSGMPITGVTTLRFYKRRDVLVSANPVTVVKRGPEDGADRTKKGFSSLKKRFASKTTSEGYQNFEKAELAKEKHDALTEKLQEKRFKTRCLVPIDVHYTLQECTGLPPELVKREKDEQDAYAAAKAKHDEVDIFDQSVEIGLPPVKPKKLDRLAVFIFSSVRADIGSGLVNSLGEALNFSITLVPRWDGRLRRYLDILWKASGAGMKWSTGFEHSGGAVAILKMVVTTSPYGDQDKHVGLAPAIEQDAQTEHHFLRGYGSATPASRTHEEELPLKEK